MGDITWSGYCSLAYCCDCSINVQRKDILKSKKYNVAWLVDKDGKDHIHKVKYVTTRIWNPCIDNGLRENICYKILNFTKVPKTRTSWIVMGSEYKRVVF